VSIKIAEGIWNLTPEQDVSCFLVVGSEKALLVDTGFGKVELKPLIAEITDLPITLVNTHGHGDHVGGNNQFDEFYISALDIPSMPGDSSKAIALEEGQKFDLGGREFEVIATPGHTPGSISLLDRANRIIFTGDMLASRPIFFIKGMSSSDDYLASMDKLQTLSSEFDAVICCHGEAKLGTDIIAKYKAAMEDFVAGKLERKEMGGDKGPKMVVFAAADGLGFIAPGM